MTAYHQHELVRQLCALNNQGVISLESNSPEKADPEFVQCLRVCNELSRAFPRPKRGTPASPDSLIRCRSSLLSPSQNSPSDKFFIFQSALNLPEKSSPPDETSVRVYSAVVVFNLALTHHHVGIKTRKSSSLIKAEQLYGTSIQMLHGLNPLSFSGTTLLIVTAANNNMAQIALENGLIMDVSRRFCLVGQALRRCKKKHRSIFTPQELNGIHSNIVLLGQGLIASPAA
eukprot:scaffold1513_cov141-Cylindrotheca_fusiformis.AAC.7